MSELWINKYHPQSLDDYIGSYETLEFYIEESLKNKTKDKGFILYGLSGTGKTTIVDLMSKKFGMDLIITNSSDKRNNIDASAFYTGSILSNNKKLAVFDEADGMTDKSFKELLKVIGNYSPIILIANDISKIPNYIKSKCFIKEVTVNKFNLKALATKIIKKESLEINSKELSYNLDIISSYRELYQYLQYNNISKKELFNKTENLQDQITFTNDNSNSPNLISQADIFLNQSRMGYKNGEKVAKFILNNVYKTTDNYPRTYRLISEVRKQKKNNGTIKILGFSD